MYRFFVDLLHPFTLLYLLTLLGVGALWRKRRERRRRLLLPTIPLAALTVFCTPAVAYLALGSLEWRYPPPGEPPGDAGAIVVLAGGLLPPDAVRPRAELAADSVLRCLHAAEVYRRAGRRPVLVSGGKVDPGAPGPTLARAMRELLEGSGVAASDIIEEGRSRTTHENAVECAELLRGLGIGRVVLVTEATHLPRAMGCFRREGVEAVPSGCHYRATEFGYALFDFLPSAEAATSCQVALHEWLGLAWYRLRGWA